jgi:hypothetical protein
VNGVPWNFGPGYNMQSISGAASLLEGEARYVSIITTGYDPALGDPCAYLNDAGTAVEKGGWDYHSNPGDCRDTGGVWVPPGNTIKFTPNGDYYFTPSVWQMMIDPQMNGGLCSTVNRSTNISAGIAALTGVAGAYDPEPISKVGLLGVAGTATIYTGVGKLYVGFACQ